MEFEFDKEMDAILRRARTGEAVTSQAAHLDADEISAFAENAVSGAARMRFAAHLADCTRCRKILSNTILLSTEAETETASSAVSAPATAEKAPWYRRLFVFPQLAYTMGAMVLLFSGFFGYLILKNVPGTQNSEVSFSTNRAATEKSTTANTQSAANSNAAVSNSSATANTSGNVSTSASSANSMNSAPFSVAKPTPAATLPSETEKYVEPELNAPVAVPQATPPPITMQDATKNEAARDDLAKISPAAPTASGAASQNRALREEKQKKNDKDASPADDERVNAAEQDARQKTTISPMPKRKQPSKAGEARSVGGKTFNNVGGIWFDSAVGRQKQKTVRRGTSEYSKLDAGLRSIADSLGGTVVVLWNGKAYRIQ